MRIILLMALLALTSCLSTKVTVIDESGTPVFDAQIYAIATLMEAGPNHTDVHGKAEVPDCMQDVQWVSIEKEGFIKEQVPFSKLSKESIILRKKTN